MCAPGHGPPWLVRRGGGSNRAAPQARSHYGKYEAPQPPMIFAPDDVGERVWLQVLKLELQ